MGDEYTVEVRPMKMLEELAAVVRLDRRERDHAAGYGFYLEPDAPYAALTFLQTHHATITDMAKRLEAAERDAARLDDYKEIARLIGSIFFCGEFKAETHNERELEKLLRKTGNFYDTEGQWLDAAMQESGEWTGGG